MSAQRDPRSSGRQRSGPRNDLASTKSPKVRPPSPDMPSPWCYEHTAMHFRIEALYEALFTVVLNVDVVVAMCVFLDCVACVCDACVS